MKAPDYDLCVIGGGINGVGIARDAAGRGLSVLLLEKDDLAGATSSASTKLIHGGLRYLEYYEFALVRKALRERETLLKLAPHLIQPMEFILPHDKTLRPPWMIKLGLFLYDHLAERKKLAASRGLKLNHDDPYGSPLKTKYNYGFSYTDCRVDDARLVVLNAMDAAKHGAKIMTRTKCKKLEAKDNHWLVHLDNKTSITARIVVNATGPWVREFLDQSGLSDKKTPAIRLVKGSHIIIPRLFEGEHAYILQQPDKRIVFAIPYEQKFTLIGTTEIEIKTDPGNAKIEAKEIDYLCKAVNRSFKKQIMPKDIIKSYSGVRPLLQEKNASATATTRDYKLILDKSHGPRILSVFGGKITTYRALSEKAVNMICNRGFWTDSAILPGGDIPDSDIEKFIKQTQKKYPFLPEGLCARYALTYGTSMIKFLRGTKSLKDLGKNLGKNSGDHLYEAEINYLIKEEWAQTAEDILWRRTKLGLHVSDKTKENLETFLSKITSF